MQLNNRNSFVYFHKIAAYFTHVQNSGGGIKHASSVFVRLFVILMEGTVVFDMIEREMWSHIVAAEGGIIYNRERGGMGFIATISYSESGKGEAAKPMSSVATPEEPHLWI